MAEQSPKATTMGQDRERRYVERWPNAIATRAGLSTAWVATAMQRLGALSAEASVTEYETRFNRCEYVEEVAALTPAMAKAVVAKVGEMRAEIDASDRTHCRG